MMLNVARSVKECNENPQEGERFEILEVIQNERGLSGFYKNYLED